MPHGYCISHGYWRQVSTGWEMSSCSTIAVMELSFFHQERPPSLSGTFIVYRNSLPGTKQGVKEPLLELKVTLLEMKKFVVRTNETVLQGRDLLWIIWCSSNYPGLVICVKYFFPLRKIIVKNIWIFFRYLLFHKSFNIQEPRISGPQNTQDFIDMV